MGDKKKKQKTVDFDALKKSREAKKKAIGNNEIIKK